MFKSPCFFHLDKSVHTHHQNSLEYKIRAEEALFVWCRGVIMGSQIIHYNYCRQGWGLWSDPVLCDSVGQGLVNTKYLLCVSLK